jgi:hypothetical protein
MAASRAVGCGGDWVRLFILSARGLGMARGAAADTRMTPGALFGAGRVGFDMAVFRGRHFGDSGVAFAGARGRRCAGRWLCLRRILLVKLWTGVPPQVRCLRQRMGRIAVARLGRLAFRFGMRRLAGRVACHGGCLSFEWGTGLNRFADRKVRLVEEAVGGGWPSRGYRPDFARPDFAIYSPSFLSLARHSRN